MRMFLICPRDSAPNAVYSVSQKCAPTAGGWDRPGLEELKLAASLASPVKGFAKLFVYWPSELGARLSPLTGRFPIKVREAAMAEALEIDRERVRLV